MSLISRVLMTGLLSFIFIFSYAQESKKKMTKEERKAEKERVKKENAEKENADWIKCQDLAQKKQFIIEFNRFTNPRTGETIMLNDRLNFVVINKNKIVFQVESPYHLANNGLGGVTFDDGFDGYKYTPPKNEKKPFVISFNLIGKNSIKATKIFISVYNDGKAIVTFGDSPNIYGIFKPIDESKIVVGANMRN